MALFPPPGGATPPKGVVGLSDIFDNQFNINWLTPVFGYRLPPRFYFLVFSKLGNSRIPSSQFPSFAKIRIKITFQFLSFGLQTKEIRKSQI